MPNSMHSAPVLPRPASLRQFWQDSSPQAALTGLIAILIGFAGPTVLVYAVADSAHLGSGTVMSWVWGSTVLCGVVSIYLSLRTRMPILSTWSTPGIAFLATALPGIPFPQAVGAFLISAVLVILLGTFRPLTHLIERIPMHLAAALNAAILLPFGFRAVQAFGKEPALVGLMIVTYFLLRHFSPRWAVAGVLVVGVAASAALGLLHSAPVHLALTVPQVVAPQFSWQATLNLALPLTLLAFTGQFVPGFSTLKVAGYSPAPAPIIRACGVASVGAALVGCHNLTLAALLANIVSGPEAHPDPARRYTAAVWAGVFYILLGLCAGTFLSLMALLPAEAISALAGLALLAAIGTSLQAGLREAPGTLAAPAVLVVTLSGVSLLGIGAAFWGILAGLALHAAEGRMARARAEAATPVSPQATKQPT
ncbi:benzoate/H(+) symporter BenE family transporter [Deinococcus aquatilis]|uniref:benzoate/H(+) symporter BenE family transporter n=1 Tax=Deinococcus aquatilis TaxID=519440 RepID=UPI00039A352E|nr:benzoate/H(+) symporter BenE family transporter [Deinococcus aquatilis]